MATHLIDSTRSAKEKAVYNALPQTVKDSIKRATALAEKNARRSADSASEAGEKERMSSHPLDYLSVKSWTWEKGGFGTIGIIGVTFKNSGVRSVRNIDIVVTWLGESGAELGSKEEMVTTVVAPGKTKTVSDINLGFLDEQTKSARIKILNADFD